MYVRLNFSLTTLAYILADLHTVYTHTVLTTHTTRQRAEESSPF